MELNIKGKLIGEQEIKAMLNKAPAIYLKNIRKWIITEGKGFIGVKGKPGVMRKKMQKKGWQDKFTNTAINWKITNDNKINMGMKAGVLYTNKKKIHEIMEFLGNGGTINSSKFMIVPSKNLNKGVKKHHGYFKQQLKASKLFAVYQNNKAYYFDKVTNQLMFTGVKTVKVKKQFDVENEWNKRKPSIINRCEKMIDKATTQAQKKSNL